MPANAALPSGERFRGSVTPVPAYAGPEGGLRGTFRTGNVGELAVYRAKSRARTGRLVGLTGFFAVIAGLASILWVRRR